jgi:hypothetical protein
MKRSRGTSRSAPAGSEVVDGGRQARGDTSQSSKDVERWGRGGRCRRRDGRARADHAAIHHAGPPAGGSHDERATGGGARDDAAGGGRGRSGELNPASLSRRRGGAWQHTAEGGGDEQQRLPINLLRAAADLREATATAASVAAAGSEARALGMGRRGGSYGSGCEHHTMPGGWMGRERRGETGSGRRARRG